MPNIPFFKHKKWLPNNIKRKFKDIFSKKMNNVPMKAEIRYLSLDEAIEQAMDSIKDPPKELRRHHSFDENYDSSIEYVPIEDEEIDPIDDEYNSYIRFLLEGEEVIVKLSLPPKCLINKILLPEIMPPFKQTLVLDLDETLIHSSFVEPIPGIEYSLEFSLTINDELKKVFLYCRPYLNDFLEYIKDRYECIIFTAGIEMYANEVLDFIDPEGVFTHRLYRSACSISPFGMVKDLKLLGRNMDRLVIIDNSPISYLTNVENAIPITTWESDMEDTELLNLIEFLDFIGTDRDLVPSLTFYRQGSEK